MPIDQFPSPDVRRYCEQHGFSNHVRDRGFHYLLERWTKTVTAVEGGYRRTFYEYLNDMGGLRIMDELATHASDDEWACVEAVLPALDATFLEVTRPVKSCISGERNAAKHGYRPDRDWWYYRVPRDLSRVGDAGRWQQPPHAADRAPGMV